ncbi:MAG: hypothetical protein AAB423_03095 [Patescibacteria group bacterium]
MVAVYELYGELFERVEAFLQALAHEYKVGDSDYVLSKLDDYGFDLTDLGVHPA